MAGLQIHPGTFGEYSKEYGFTEEYSEFATISYYEAMQRYYEGVAATLGMSPEEVQTISPERIAQALAAYTQLERAGEETPQLH